MFNRHSQLNGLAPAGRKAVTGIANVTGVLHPSRIPLSRHPPVNLTVPHDGQEFCSARTGYISARPTSPSRIPLRRTAGPYIWVRRRSSPTFRNVQCSLSERTFDVLPARAISRPSEDGGRRVLYRSMAFNKNFGEERLWNPAGGLGVSLTLAGRSEHARKT